MSFAETYTCSDISHLEELLSSLKATCGGGSNTVLCRANGRIGSTPSEAVDSCYKNTAWNMAQCEADVTCQGNISFCRANGRIGNTVTEAVDSCYKNTAWNMAQCEAGVTCN